MSGSDVYKDEMPNSRFCDQDVERLLSGETSEDDALAVFAPLVEALRTEWLRHPSEEIVASFSRAAAEIAATEGADAVVNVKPARPARRSNVNLRRRLVIPLAAVLALSGMTGAAFAADDALPGDSLYGVKLAFEKVGLRTGGVAERLAEAAAMAERGRAAEALAHAAVAVAQVGTQQPGNEEALTGLDEAIAQVQQALPEQGDTDHANEVRNNVATMLQWMRDNVGLMDDPNTEPGAFGRGVAGRARQISSSDDSADDEDDERPDGDSGPPQGVNPGGPPKGNPPTHP